MKTFLKKQIEAKKAKMAELLERSNKSESVDEVRSINAEMETLRNEISEFETQMDSLDEGEKRGINPMATFTTATENVSRGTIEDSRATMEYRTAFMNYVQRGATSDILEHRQNDQNESTDLGVLLPTTVVQQIITGVENVYGQLYARVRKTNIKGGIKYPIGSFTATFNRIGENGAPTDRQNGGSITGFVEFSYKLGEIRLAQTLLASVLTVPVFEDELAKVIVEAYVKAMDNEILNGESANNQMEGIITEAKKTSGSRIEADHIIEFTADEMADWTSWQKKLFAKIPLSMRNLSPEFVMTANTYEANIKTLKDKNDRPVYYETYNPIDGAETARFKGKEVVFVEEGLGIVNFDDGGNGDVFALYWVGNEAYAINTNLEFAVTRYFDNEKLQYVDRAVVINDGKILDPKYLYVLKKKVSG